MLNDYQEIEIVGPLKTNLDDISGSLERLQSNLDAVQGIYVSNAELANVAKHLSLSAGTTRKVLIGHDMNDEIYHYLSDGIITATISQAPIRQGYLAVKKLFESLTGQERMNPKEIITKLEVVIKENARFYLGP